MALGTVTKTSECSATRKEIDSGDEEQSMMATITMMTMAWIPTRMRWKRKRRDSC